MTKDRKSPPVRASQVKPAGGPGPTSEVRAKRMARLAERESKQRMFDLEARIAQIGRTVPRVES